MAENKTTKQKKGFSLDHNQNSPSPLERAGVRTKPNRPMKNQR